MQRNENEYVLIGYRVVTADGEYSAPSTPLTRILYQNINTIITISDERLNNIPNDTVYNRDEVRKYIADTVLDTLRSRNIDINNIVSDHPSQHEENIKALLRIGLISMIMQRKLQNLVASEPHDHKFMGTKRILYNIEDRMELHSRMNVFEAAPQYSQQLRWMSAESQLDEHLNNCCIGMRLL
jgi:hypothetical protein